VEAHSETAKKKAKKKKKTSQSHLDPSTTTTASMWAAICKETSEHFRYKMEFACADSVCEALSVTKVPLLRGICNKVGIQLFLKNYSLSETTIFTEDDVAGIFPVIKHAAPRCQEGEALMAAAEAKLNNGELQEAAELVMEALSILNTVFGPIHELIGSCNRMLARIHFIAGQHTVALSYQQRAAYIIERVNGVDHRSTIAAYIQLAMYSHECGQTRVALRLMFRARYLMKLIYGEGHPEVAVCDVNMAIMLNAIKHNKDAFVFLQNALEVNKKYLGESSFHVGMNHHLMAQWMSAEGDFRGALSHEKAANGIFESQVMIMGMGMFYLLFMYC
jgi:protein TIF31